MKKTLGMGLILVLWGLAGCGLTNPGLSYLEGGRYDWESDSLTSLRLYFFLSPDCPLCENYTLTINRLRAELPEDSIQFFGVFPGKYYTEKEIRGYLREYKPAVISLLDPDYTFTHGLGATVTPEVFMMDRKGEVLYSGKIDNWIAKLGTKRSIVTRYYLKDALASYQKNQPIDPSYVRPVGCFIE